MQKIHRRYLILLIGLTFLACFSVIVVGLLILNSTTRRVGGVTLEPSPTPGPQPTHTVVHLEVTALKQYPLAEQAAKGWATDALLVSASAHWPQVLSVGQAGEPIAWSYRFYSPARARLFFVTVKADGQLRTVEHVVRVTLAPRPIAVDSWLIDSSAALGIWLDYGGGRMLQTNPGLELLVQLRIRSDSPNPVWMVVGLDDRTEDMLVVIIDANQGVVTKTNAES